MTMEIENSSTIQGLGNPDPASSCSIEQNASGTGGKIDTPLTQAGSLHVPASLDTFNMRRALIAKRNATSDPVRKEQLQILIEQCDLREPAAAMAKQIGVIDGTTRATPFE